MCEDCGCSLTDREALSSKSQFHPVHDNPQLNDANTVAVSQNILHKNDHEAEHNRAHFGVGARDMRIA